MPLFSRRALPRPSRTATAPRRTWPELLAKYRRHLAAALAMLSLALCLAVLAPDTVERIEVLVAERDLPVGTLLRADDFATRSVPRSLVPEGSYAGSPPVDGSRLAIPVLAGTPVHARTLYK